MKCCIFGAGAIGGHLAVKLRAAGQEVSVVARGAQLAAINESGLVLEQNDRSQRVEVAASAEPADLGPQDLVFIATKATALPDVAARIAPLVGKHTVVAFLQNGMTWWYPIGLPQDHPVPPRLPVFDLALRFLAVLRSDQVLGGIVYSANEIVRPGVIRNNSPAHNLIELAGLDDVDSGGVRLARAALEAAGISSPPVKDIRAALWLKLVVNASASSLCVATGNPAAIVTDPAIAQTFLRTLDECVRIAAAHGYPVGDRLDPQRWIQHRTRHKPSMLQDFEAGRPMEVAEMVLAPVAFARAAGLGTPTLDAVAAIAARLAMDKGLFTAAPPVATPP